MATTLSVNPIKVQLGWSYDSVNTFGTVPFANTFTYSATLANGTGAGAAQKLYVNTLTINASSTTTLDLNATSGTAITDVFGSNITFTKVKVLYVYHKTTAATAVLKVSGTWLTSSSGTPPIILGGTSPTASINVRPGGCVLLSCSDATGYATTDSSADSLTLNNTDAAAVTVDVVVIGE